MKIKSLADVKSKADLYKLGFKVRTRQERLNVARKLMEKDFLRAKREREKLKDRPKIL